MTAVAEVSHTAAETAGRPRRLRFFLIYVLPPLIALIIVLVPTLSSAAVLPRLGVSPGFALSDQQGQLVTNETLRGEIVLYSVASTACPDVCAASLAAVADVRARLAADADADPPVRFVTVLVDADGDRAVLEDFAADHGIEGADWSLLTGSDVAVRSVVSSGFEVYLEQPGDGPVDHGPGLFLADQAGFLRAEYRTGTPNSGVIADDIERIRTEANAGTIGGLFYDAAHSLNLSCGT